MKTPIEPCIPGKAILHPPQDFSKVVGDWACVELADVLANPDDYGPELVEAAKDELRRRHFSKDQTARLQSAFITLFALNPDDRFPPGIAH